VKVSACLVTRGDVDMRPVLDSLPAEWEIILWDNESWIDGEQAECHRILPHHRDEIDETWPVQNLSVYGRYAAIEYASHDLIWVCDDDVIVSDPQAIVDAWIGKPGPLGDAPYHAMAHLVANMPSEFRHAGYVDSCLVGFGSCFHRNLPAKAFQSFVEDTLPQEAWETAISPIPTEFFQRTCDVLFTTLTPRVLVDVAKTNREFATDSSRMYRQPGHIEERTRMLQLARQVRDA
jgi:hypothetical protein